MNINYLSALCGGLLLLLNACQSDDGIQLDPEKDVVVTAADIELPANVENCLKITHTFPLNGREVVNYTTDYDTINYIPRWVAFKFYKAVNQSTVKRIDNFRDDPQLPSRFYLGRDAHFPGYDRGHLCASADRLVTRQANDDTFFFTNMCPQLGDFNQKIWASLEAQVRVWRTQFDTLYVVRGGILQKDGKTIDVNGKKMAVPYKYWMALLGRNVSKKGDAFTAIGFSLEHKEYGGTSNFSEQAATISNNVVSIDELERQTGLDFFSSLPETVQTTVEATVLKSKWKGVK